jgi:hypothetical protein
MFHNIATWTFRFVTALEVIDKSICMIARASIPDVTLRGAVECANSRFERVLKEPSTQEKTSLLVLDCGGSSGTEGASQPVSPDLQQSAADVRRSGYITKE